MDREQRIRDPIHNLVKFSPDNPDDEILWLLLQSEPLQRLRRIKQLGFSDIVYPGASHSRLSHSIGAMQMARRMLDVLEKNNVFTEENKEEHKKWRQATLCAALLHDVGHGPFSHVFEDVSHIMKIEISHENYTEKIIQDGPVAEILKTGGVLEETLSFFRSEAGSTTYSQIVSSQLDADRLDFLARDRHFTGIQFGEIDLEWLFDSLRIIEIPVDVGMTESRYVFALNQKGLSVVEDFLSAYSKMYSNVYFHKTTRSVQYMVLDILSGIFSDDELKRRLPEDNLILQYFNAAPNPPLESYLKLDDASVTYLLRHISLGNFGDYTDLANRYFRRELYKCFEPPKRPKDEPPRQKLADFIKAIKDEEILHHMDLLPAKGLKQYDIMGEEFFKNILVFSKFDNEYRPIGDLSPAVEDFADRNPLRFYFRTDADRQRASNIWNDA